MRTGVLRLLRMSIALVSAMFACCFLAACQNVCSPVAPFDIKSYYKPTGYMGDGEVGARYLQMKEVAQAKARPGDNDNLVWKITYHPGPKNWAGVYWQDPPDNWGDKAGCRIRGAGKIRFWAVGEKGGEVVEFKGGGIATGGKRYRDSFEVTLGSVGLTSDWKRYEIDLTGRDLSSVIGAFAWVATADSNAGGLTFYLDAIEYVPADGRH